MVSSKAIPAFVDIYHAPAVVSAGLLTASQNFYLICKLYNVFKCVHGVCSLVRKCLVRSVHKRRNELSARQINRLVWRMLTFSRKWSPFGTSFIFYYHAAKRQTKWSFSDASSHLESRCWQNAQLKSSNISKLLIYDLNVPPFLFHTRWFYVKNYSSNNLHCIFTSKPLTIQHGPP